MQQTFLRSLTFEPEADCWNDAILGHAKTLVELALLRHLNTVFNTSKSA